MNSSDGKTKVMADPDAAKATVLYIFTEHCDEDLGAHYDGCAEGPAGFDFSDMRARYWTIMRTRRYKADGSSLTIGDIDAGYQIPPHPGYFGEFVVSNSSEFRAFDVVINPDYER
jgi:hypothetical protein